MNKFRSVLAATTLAATVAGAPPASATEPFIGQIQFFAFPFAVRNWAQCDGQLLPISSNTALFSLIGTIYGGNGSTTFALPDARGRALIHKGGGPGLPDFQIGAKGGVVSNTLTVNQLPPHAPSVALRANAAAGDTGTPAANTVLAAVGRGTNYSTSAPDVDMSPQAITVGTVGRAEPVQNMQPYLAVNCQIALFGIFPSRS